MSYAQFLSSGLLIFSCYVLSIVFGCFPSQEHPQGKFCRSYFVIHGTAKSVIKINGPPGDVNDNDAVYKYSILVISKLKGPDQIKKGKEVIVETSGNGALCSISLTIGDEYVLSGFKTANGGFRSLASNIVYRVKDLGTTPSIRDYLLGTGINTYKRNCDRGCKDISTKSIHCKIPDPTALQCYTNNAICRERYGKCKWYNADSCKLSAPAVP
ncbi:uncharacterized protein LOC127712195 [Mytilus californianus]|uniref:uncharacterized protein LOC127712195 n=1 Tax=Mytilus californianus TaxID=6549 RepID=UPI0022455276|nr:uncharacterized protein LOC127712195 [Mytilus californianus]